MQARAFAKLNLGLRVRGRLPLSDKRGGMHVLESLVAFVAVADTITIAHTSTDNGADNTPPDLPADNLVRRAHRALEQASGRTLDCHLSLQKRIPIAAGLGGGSADAAATLRLLVKFFGLDATPALPAIAATLGADVPVCLSAQPAWMCGTGEQISRLSPLPQADIVLVNPRRALSTAQVFKRLRASHAPYGELAAAQSMPVAFGGFAALCAHVAAQGNDLTQAAIAIVPSIADCLRVLEKCGAPIAAMSGSGATCFALVGRGEGAALARAYGAARPQDWCVATQLISAADAKINE